jgi:hypothetical protein
MQRNHALTVVKAASRLKILAQHARERLEAAENGVGDSGGRLMLTFSFKLRDLSRMIAVEQCQ